jgi:hypothetical protein
MKVVRSSAVASILFAGLAGAAQAAQFEVDLSSFTNANLQTYTEGTNYPTAGSTVSIGGVSFLVSSDAGAAGTTGAIQVSSPSDSFVVPVDQTGYQIIYVLVNSAFGEIGKTVGSLVFENSVGDKETIDLEEGINIRDHWTAYNNIAPHIYGTATYPGGVRFDAYNFLLPAGTLTSITLNGGPDTGFPNGEPFLAGVTLATSPSPVPETSTWAMMIAGFAGLGWLGHSRRRAIGSAAA